jgi:phage gpG-like protein
MGVEVTFDTKELRKIRKLADAIIRDGGKIDKPLKRFGVYMMGQTDKTFRSSGRGNVKWKPLSEATLSIRESLGRGGLSTMPLMGEGMLKRSIDSKVEGPKHERRQVTFTDNPVAPFHQHGARIRVFGRGPLKRLPKREILFFTKEDKEQAVKEFTEHADKVARDAVRKSGTRR